MRISLPSLAGVMCTLCVPFVVFPHIWVAPVYAVNVVATVMVCVNIYVVILTHITMKWDFQKLIVDISIPGYVSVSLHKY